MSRSIQANLKLKGKRKTYFDRKPEKILKPTNIDTEQLQPKMSLVELLEFRRTLKRKKRKLLLKRLVISGILMLAILLSLFQLIGSPW